MHTRAFRHLQTGSAPVGPMLLLLGAALLSLCAQQACARTAKVTSAWQDNVPHGQSFTRVLVVGVSPNVDQRCAFEYFLVSRINSESVQAIRSCDAVTKKNPLTLESIEQAVAAVQADAVLATSLISREVEAKEGGSRDTRGSALYKATDAGWATGYYGVYGVPVIYGEFETAAAISVAEGKVNVASRLYETRDKTLIYTLDTQARNLESTDAALAEVAAAIADRLRRDKLIR